MRSAALPARQAGRMPAYVIMVGAGACWIILVRDGAAEGRRHMTLSVSPPAPPDAGNRLLLALSFSFPRSLPRSLPVSLSLSFCLCLCLCLCLSVFLSVSLFLSLSLFLFETLLFIIPAVSIFQSLRQIHDARSESQITQSFPHRIHSPFSLATFHHHAHSLLLSQ